MCTKRKRGVGRQGVELERGGGEGRRKWRIAIDDALVRQLLAGNKI